ncbi:unnamed protein product [Arctogadus glacialis]
MSAIRYKKKLHGGGHYVMSKVKMNRVKIYISQGAMLSLLLPTGGLFHVKNYISHESRVSLLLPTGVLCHVKNYISQESRYSP